MLMFFVCHPSDLSPLESIEEESIVKFFTLHYVLAFTEWKIFFIVPDSV